MIFERALRRELAYTTGAVFLVFLTVMLTMLVIRILGHAATGRVNPADVVVLIGLAGLGYLAILLTLSMFVAVLIVLTRWYRDSEMVVWFASGLSLRDFVGPVLRFASPFLLCIALLAFVGWPWANQKSAELRERFAQRDDLSMIAPGQFRESAGSNRVFFIDKLNETSTRVENLFVSSTDGGKIGVAVARLGAIETTADGDKFVVLDNGRRYEGEPGKPDFRVIEFERYGVKIYSKPVVASTDTPVRDTPTGQLIHAGSPVAQGELAWRIGLPLMALVLVLTAIPLAYVNPRRGRYTAVVVAVLFYLIYSNLMSLVQAWVAQSRISFAMGWWPLHLTGLAIAICLFYARQQQVDWARRLFGWLRPARSSGARRPGAPA